MKKIIIFILCNFFALQVFGQQKPVLFQSELNQYQIIDDGNFDTTKASLHWNGNIEFSNDGVVIHKMNYPMPLNYSLIILFIATIFSVPIFLFFPYYINRKYVFKNRILHVSFQLIQFFSLWTFFMPIEPIIIYLFFGTLFLFSYLVAGLRVPQFKFALIGYILFAISLLIVPILHKINYYTGAIIFGYMLGFAVYAVIKNIQSAEKEKSGGDNRNLLPSYLW